MIERLNMKNNEFITTGEASKILKVSLLTIYRYIKAGKLPAYKIGRDYRIKKEEFDKFLEEKRVK